MCVRQMQSQWCEHRRMTYPGLLPDRIVGSWDSNGSGGRARPTNRVGLLVLPFSFGVVTTRLPLRPPVGERLDGVCLARCLRLLPSWPLLWRRRSPPFLRFLLLGLAATVAFVPDVKPVCSLAAGCPTDRKCSCCQWQNFSYSSRSANRGHIRQRR